MNLVHLPSIPSRFLAQSMRCILCVELAPAVSIRGARLVAEPRLPTLAADETTRIPWLVAWNEPIEIASLK